MKQSGHPDNCECTDCFYDASVPVDQQETKAPDMQEQAPVRSGERRPKLNQWRNLPETETDALDRARVYFAGGCFYQAKIMIDLAHYHQVNRLEAQRGNATKKGFDDEKEK